MKNNWLKCLGISSVLLLGSCEGSEPKIQEPDPVPVPEVDFETYHYNLPVIFHLIYTNSDNSVQAISQKRLESMLGRVNAIYAPSNNSAVNMNVSFVLAETTPDGVPLKEKGIERILWTGAYPIDFEQFMQKESNVSLIWDPNKYINVMIYVFTNSSVGGVSHFPYTIAGKNALEGVTAVEYTTINASQLKYPHCISINASSIQSQSDNTINDPSATLGHELGHYLGLYHVFSELVNSNACGDTDYCIDTPSYNRTAYESYFETIYSKEGLMMDKLLTRTSCTGSQFVSTNTMDYYVSYRDRFSADQRTRVRNVVNYSPLIPGPKANTSKSISSDEKLDLPMRIMRCSAPATAR